MQQNSERLHMSFTHIFETHCVDRAPLVVYNKAIEIEREPCTDLVLGRLTQRAEESKSRAALAPTNTRVVVFHKQ